MTAADVLVEKLIDWGVDLVFGLPGDGINGIMEALRIRQDKIRFIQVRHEEAAAFMACGYAKMTGRIGVCLATSGPGAIHLLNGLYDAKLDYQPVLAITGLQFHDLIGTWTQQDVETDKLFMDACVYNQRIMGPAHVENIVDLAVRTAISYRGVAHVTMPVDMQEKEVKDRDRSKRNQPHHVSEVRTHGVRLPAQEDIRRAAHVLNEGKKIAILAGAGALHAGDELEQVAEILGAPIAKALLGKACVPDDSPYTTGSIGLLGTAASQKIMEECDTLFIVGAGFPYIEYYPKPGQARCVQIDCNPAHIALRYPVEVGLVGDSKGTLQQLLPLLHRNDNRDFLTSAQKMMKEWWEYMEKEGTADSVPMKPQVVAWELGKRLHNDAIVTCDSGTIATWYARQIPARRGMKMTLSGNLATMAPGLPYANAAQIAFPDRQVVAFVGDGGYSMLMAEMATAAKYKLPIKVVVMKNDYLGQIKWEQMVFLGNPEFGVDLYPIDFVKAAEACGATGFHLDKPALAGSTIDSFLNHPGPAVLEAVVDPLTPPLPGKIKPEQALHFVESLVRGEPDAEKIFVKAMKDKARQLL